MKQIILLALGLVLSATGFAQKFGYCNSNVLLAQIPEVKAADSDLQAFQTQLTKKGQDMVKSLQDRAAELDRRKKAGTIAPKEEETLTATLQADQEKIGAYEKEVYEKMAQKREALYKPILDKVNLAMDAVAKDNGFMLVFDAGNQLLLYADESLDVTKLVKAKLGI